MSSET